MTAQDYLQTKLNTLKQASVGMGGANSTDELVETIFRLLLSKKFRKYAASDALQQHIRQVVKHSIENNTPINLTFTQGGYKLWRLEEAPEADWAELFALMYYTNWLKPICQVYEPGVWMDFFVDDLILPVLDDVTLAEVAAYKASFESLLAFINPYQPSNLRMTITGVGEQFESQDAFYEQLAKDVSKFAKNFDNGLPEVSAKEAAMIELNAKPNPEKVKDPLWLQRNKLTHDAYLTHTKAETGYHNRPDKIKVFSQPLASGMFLAPGTTKDSIAKHWAGVGVLRPRDDDYRQVILTPSQLKNTACVTEPVQIDGLVGKNFRSIRIVSS